MKCKNLILGGSLFVSIIFVILLGFRYKYPINNQLFNISMFHGSDGNKSDPLLFDLKKDPNHRQRAKTARKEREQKGRDFVKIRETIVKELQSGLAPFANTNGNISIPPIHNPGRGYGKKTLNPEQQKAIDALLEKTGPDTQIQIDQRDSTLRYLEGNLVEWVRDSSAYQDGLQRSDYTSMATATLNSLSRVMNVVSPEDEFQLRQSDRDELNMTHVTFDQYYQGVPIYGAQVIVHFDQKGNPVRLNGVYASTITTPVASTPEIDTATAIQSAWNALGKTDPALLEPKVERMYYWDPNVSPVLTYRVALAPNTSEYWEVFVSAFNGSLLKKVQCVKSAAVTGQAADLLGIKRTVHSWQEGASILAVDTSLTMFDSARSRPPVFTNQFGVLCLFDVKNQDVDVAMKKGIAYVQTANKDQWDPTAVSVLQSFTETFQYFKTIHNRNSFDDKNGNITGLIHAQFKNPDGQLYKDNAFFNPGMNIVVFGDGEQSVKPGLLPASVDVTAHEITHGVVDNSAAFKYENQSGALHEHMADFFACMVDRGDWIMGEDSMAGTQFAGWRDLSDPHNAKMKSPGPKTMAEYKNLPNTAQGDYGGVHVNSTIPSYATYLLTAGPQGIGREKAEKIIYRALTKYMTQNSGFVDYRRAAIASAKDLFPNGTELKAVTDAFDTIELYEAESKPAPTPVPPTSGEEMVLFLQENVDPFFGISLGYGLYVLTTQNILPIASRYTSLVRPAVSGDGKWALYVGDNNDVYFTDGTQEQRITQSGNVRTIAMSKDQRYVAFTTTDYDNTIIIIDITNDKVQTATLSIPTSGDETKLSYADVLSFNCIGDTLYFDAWTEGKMAQTEYGCWGLFSLRLKDFACRAVLPVSPGLQVGNPSLANTMPNHMVADYIYTTNGQMTIGSVALDLNQNKMSILFKDLNTFAAASFRGDDKSIVFQTLENGTYYLNEARIDLNSLNLASGVNKLIWSANSLAYPVGFRSGAYAPPAGNLVINPNQLNFGSLAIGQVLTNSIVLTNSGNADLELIEISLENGEINSYDFASVVEKRIPAGKGQQVKIIFHPDKTGPLAVTLRAKTNIPGKPDVAISLSGTGTGSVKFGFRNPGIKRDASGITLFWDSQVGRQYHVLRSSTASGGYSIIASNIPANPPINQYLDSTITSKGSYFYRLQLK